jgi:uncharacterized protein YeaO (DUF488 family)
MELMGVRVKRVSDLAAEDEGDRVLVDRYWPRGIQRDGAYVDDWCHEVAPSPELIAWYGRKHERWDEFKRRYHAELKRPHAAAALLRLRERAAAAELTLLYASRDRECNGAVALAAFLEPMLADAPAPVRGVTPPRQRRTGPPRALSPQVLGWGWLALGLSVPLVLLLGGEVLVVFGRSGAILVASLLAALCAMTVVKAYREEKRGRQVLGDLPPNREGYTSLIVPIKELGLAMAGYALGFAGLVLALYGAVLLGRLVA